MIGSGKAKDHKGHEVHVILMTEEKGQTFTALASKLDEDGKKKFKALLRPLIITAIAEAAHKSQYVHVDAGEGNYLIEGDVNKPTKVNVIDWGETGCSLLKEPITLQDAKGSAKAWAKDNKMFIHNWGNDE